MPQYSITLPNGDVLPLPDPTTMGPGEIDELKATLHQMERKLITPTLPTWGEIGVQAARGTAREALPVAGQVAGLIGGTALGGPPLGVTLEALGGAGGEFLAQKTGLAEPSPGGIVMAGAIPPTMRGVGAGARATGMLPARLFAGREAFSEAAGSALRKKLLPGSSFEELMVPVRAGGQTRIPLEGINKTIDDIFAAEARQANTATRKKIEESLQPIKDFVSVPREELPFNRPFVGIRKGAETEGRTIPKSFAQPKEFDLTADQIFKESTRLRREAFEIANPEVAQKLYAVRESMLNAMEKGGVPVKVALVRYKKEEAVETLGNIAFRPKPVQAFKDIVKRDNYFATAFSDKEKEDILRVLRQLPGISQSGSRGIIGRGIIGATGIAQQNIPLTIAGMTAPDIIGSALADTPGRQFLKFMLTHTGQQLTFPALALIGQFMRTRAAGTQP